VRIFVTGWNGLLGSTLVPVLGKKHEVEGFGIDDGDVSDEAFVRSRLEAFGPDVVIHLAAMTEVDACESREEEVFRVNEEGSRLSTDYVFDGVKKTPYNEDDPPGPLGVYGRSKLAGEEAVKAQASRWTVVRSAWLYGEGGRNFVDTMAELLVACDIVYVVNDQIGSPTYARDLAQGIETLVEEEARGVIHVVNPGEVSWFDLARETARLVGQDPSRVHPASTAEVGRPAPRPAYSVLDTARAEEAYGLRLRSWQEALAYYLKSRDHGPDEETR
jgi:dTDP-4-dehydrorhamnose reductase